MTSRVVVIALVGAGCVGAAGLGGYLAVRSAAVPMAAPSSQEQRIGDAGPARPATNPGPPELPALRPATPEPAPKNQVNGAAPAPKAATVKRAPAEPVATSLASPPAQLPPAAEPEATLPALPVVEQQTASSVLVPDVPSFDERTVSSDAVIGIRLETPLSSETSRVEDHVMARVIRDVQIEGHTAIPAGSRLEGSVTVVDRGGKMRDRSRIGLRFSTLVVGDERIPIQTEAIFRDGEPPSNEAASKIGASAVIGSILGAVLGGRRGAAVGTVAGAAGGTAAVMSGSRNEASIPAGTPLTVRLTAPVTVLTPHEE